MTTNRRTVRVPATRRAGLAPVLAPAVLAVGLVVSQAFSMADGTWVVPSLTAAADGASAPVGRLVSSTSTGATCLWDPAADEDGLRNTGMPSLQARAAERLRSVGGAAVRVIRDPYPSFSAVAVDMQRGEVVAADENLLQILVYDRLTNTPPKAVTTEPRRAIGGDQTKIDFVCGLYLDQRTGVVRGVNNDTQNTLVGFSREAHGDVPPNQELETPHGTFGIAVDEQREELFLTVQHTSAVVVYRKEAAGKELPLRLLQGDRTQLADPHGIAVDPKDDLVFVTNHGSVQTVNRPAGAWLGADYLSDLKATWPLERAFAVPGSGRIVPPSITVYGKTANGDTAPVRVIAGPDTQLNWPSGIVIDPKRDELFVANDTGDSILVFRKTDAGNVAPTRVIRGPKTGLKNPTGVFMDTVHDELWVANFGAHSLTVYRPTADGDTPPLRTIRSGPPEKRSLMIGNPGALAFDSKREEVLVPN